MEKQFKTPESVRARNREAVRRWKAKHPERYAESHRKQNLKRYHDLKAQGRCALCGKVPPRPERIYCEKCADTLKTKTGEWKTRMANKGLCTTCGKFPCLPATVNRRDCFCEHCYFRKTSTDCLKTSKYAEFIGQKLKKQNYRCAYTGQEIILGLNDSLDHILPVSRFPELARDPSNVEWVTRKVNCMKWDSTRDEFIATAYAVVRHFESSDLKSDNA